MFDRFRSKEYICSHHRQIRKEQEKLQELNIKIGFFNYVVHGEYLNWKNAQDHAAEYDQPEENNPQEDFNDALPEDPAQQSVAPETSSPQVQLESSDDFPALGGSPRSSPKHAQTSSPKPGDLRKGYIFRGGNPADQASWTKAPEGAVPTDQ